MTRERPLERSTSLKTIRDWRGAGHVDGTPVRELPGKGVPVEAPMDEGLLEMRINRVAVELPAVAEKIRIDDGQVDPASREAGR